MKRIVCIKNILISSIAVVLVSVLILDIFTSCGKESSFSAEGVKSESEIERVWEKGRLALNHSEFVEAVACGNRLLDLASSTGNDDAEAYGKILLGQGYLFSDSTMKAYNYLHDAEILCLKTHNDVALSSVYNGLGLYSSNIERDYPEALRYLFQGLEAAKRSGSARMHSILLANVASLYAVNNDPSGIRYALECYNQGVKTNDRFLQYTGAMTAAYSYAMSGKDTREGLEYVKKAELIHHDDSIQDGANLYYVYGVLLRQDNRDEEAAECFKESIKATAEKESEGDVRSFVEYADILMKDGRSQEAMAMLDSAFSITERGHSLMFRRNLLNSLSNMHKRLGHAELYVRYAEMAKEEDAIENNPDATLLIQHIKSKYDLERADNELNRQHIELLEKRNAIRVMVGIVIIVLIVVGGLIYLYRRKSRLYAAIVNQATESAREEERLRETIRTLSDRITKTENESISERKDEDDTDSINAKSSGIADTLATLAPAFESLMLDPKVYTDPNISKEKIADLLDTNRTYVSRIVNEIYHMSLPQYINSLRIKEAIRRLSDPSCNIPLKALSADLGYSSMTTFYSKFNEATGMAPAAFREKARSIQSHTELENS